MSDGMRIRRLPKGIQSFEKIRKDDFVYVDKTDMVWQIANGDQYSFLSRPRRFGKSLLTSTLECYFEGRKELFEGLKIMSLEKEWKKRQVFHFDFSGCESKQSLINRINLQLSTYEKIFGKDENAIELGDRMLVLMMKAYEKTGEQVAVLVDEYDAPLQNSLFDSDRHNDIVRIYRSFFPVMKTGDKYLKCLFLTGITKFTQLSLFSVLNNVSILSTWPQYASICGITRQEIADNFQPELMTMADVNGWTLEETLDELRDMYDGYRFSSDLNQAVYNPFSVINALSESKLKNFWAASGASNMLNKMLIRAYDSDMNLEQNYIPADSLDMADVTPDSVTLFLYQTGYLTIKDYSDDLYTLGIPNKEVRRALLMFLASNRHSC